MRKTIILTMITLMTFFFTFNKSLAQSGNLVLWNTLGSQEEVENSMIGPDGLLSGGNFMPGMFGNAYVATYAEDKLLSFPAVPLPLPEGAIEFWAKLIGFPPYLQSGGDLPAFVIAQFSNYPILRFTGNDGSGGGGLSATIHGVTTSSHSYGAINYATILGDSQVGEWHHYAVVWSEFGIPAAGNNKIAIYLDGELKSNRWHNNVIIPLGPGISLLRNQLNQGNVAIDNIKVWNYAKTDFSDRFEEDSDIDGDGILNIVDNCPFDYNPDQEDWDNDGDGDVCDLDDDNDNVEDINDNCPLDFNTDQADTDYDGLGDVCDVTFNTGAVVDALESESSASVDSLIVANPPGASGMIKKISGKGSIVEKVAKAETGYASGDFGTETYIDKLLNGALTQLDDYDAQLEEKITNGRIIEPEASELQEYSANMRDMINNLISEALSG